MKSQALILIALLGAACGEDDPPPPQTKAAPGAPGAPAAKKDSKRPQLQPRVHVEERVECPVPDKPSGAACTKDAPACETGLYCLQVGDKWSCEPCPERDSIRHEFKDRDFVADQVRDPFQSFIIVQKGLEEPVDKKQEGPCNRQDQFVATNYSYLDLKLVGIVAQGTQRKVLMMDRGNLGHIIRRGDCVGKEKAVVKDIGTGYVTFLLTPDPEDKNPNKTPVERSVQLHPKGLQVAPQPDPNAGGNAPSAPIVAPPTGQPAPAPAPAPGPGPAPAPAP